MSKFTIGQQIDLTQGFHNSRISVVAYDAQATIAANYSDINNINDLNKILGGLKTANTQQADLYE